MFADKDTIAMLQAVLKPGQPGGRLWSLDPDPPNTELTVEPVDQSISTNSDFSVSVIADRPTDNIDAVVEVERAFANGRTEKEEVRIRYSGGFVRSIPLEFKSPGERAIVAFAVRPNGAATSSGLKKAVLVIAPDV